MTLINSWRSLEMYKSEMETGMDRLLNEMRKISYKCKCGKLIPPFTSPAAREEDQTTRGYLIL